MRSRRPSRITGSWRSAMRRRSVLMLQSKASAVAERVRSARTVVPGGLDGWLIACFHS